MRRPLGFHRSGDLQQFAIEDADGKHLCLVFTEDEAREVVEAMNDFRSGAREFIERCRTVGLGDSRSAEALLAMIRVESVRIMGAVAE